ncbi:hypothetical protein HMPREF0972_02611 [Actinomyces sp. oral taxon 848 str. F0332]|nr:hypothetical protein HMPREF0972_02611 [Actinomyces sp. oral taxon 848 str. F0332]
MKIGVPVERRVHVLGDREVGLGSGDVLLQFVAWAIGVERRKRVGRVVADDDERTEPSLRPFVDELRDVGFGMRIRGRAVDAVVEAFLNVDDDEGCVLSFHGSRKPAPTRGRQWHECRLPIKFCHEGASGPFAGDAGL